MQLYFCSFKKWVFLNTNSEVHKKRKEKNPPLLFDMWLLSLILAFQATPPRVYFTAKRHVTSETWLLLKATTILHTAAYCFHVSLKHPTRTVGGNCVSVIYDLPALHGYATIHVFRCIIRDLIRITASKIPFKWNCSQKTMANTSSRRLFLFSAHQKCKANSCFHDGRQEGHKLCCLLPLLLLLGHMARMRQDKSFF